MSLSLIILHYMTLNAEWGKREIAAKSRAVGRALLNLLFPPRCLACGVAVDAQGNLCAACWKETAFLSRPYCDCCGLPFEFPVEDTALCGACIGDRPPYTRARALMKYGDGSRKIILALKHADHLESVPVLARWMATAGADLLEGADMIIPVPLHRWRLFRRRYNQSALLALSLGRMMGKPVKTLVLKRIRATPPQQGLKRRQRQENVRAAFQVSDAAARHIAGLKLLLVDDVFTTGATLEACTKELLKAGAASVDVLTIARVVLPDSDII